MKPAGITLSFIFKQTESKQKIKTCINGNRNQSLMGDENDDEIQICAESLKNINKLFPLT